MIKTTLLIGLGSFIGGGGRYLIWRLMNTHFTSTFPFGTFTVNVVGCFLIGAVLGWASRNYLEMNWQLFLTTGILGGFTTFSTFSLESFYLLKDGHAPIAILYVGLSLVVGLMATMAGYYLLR